MLCQMPQCPLYITKITVTSIHIDEHLSSTGFFVCSLQLHQQLDSLPQVGDSRKWILRSVNILQML